MNIIKTITKIQKIALFSIFIQFCKEEQRFVPQRRRYRCSLHAKKKSRSFSQQHSANSVGIFYQKILSFVVILPLHLFLFYLRNLLPLSLRLFSFLMLSPYQSKSRSFFYYLYLTFFTIQKLIIIIIKK